MRIGLFATWLSQSAGGIENMCYNMYIHMKKKYDVKAFSLKVSDEERLEGVDYSKTARRTVPLPEYLKFFRRENKTKPFTRNIAMHCGIGVVTLLLKWVYGIPYVVYVYSKEIKYFSTPFHKAVTQMVLRGADEIIAISQYAADISDTLIKEKKATVIHPGLDEDAFQQGSAGYVQQQDSDIIKLFTISRLVKRKGIDTTLKAVRLLKEEGYSVQYSIAGKGEYEPELRDLVSKMELDSEVVFLGRISTEDKYRKMQAADLFVMPSHELPQEHEVEGFGIVYLEANAIGKYVVAGNSGGIPDAVKQDITGCLVDGSQPERIRDAIKGYYHKSSQEKRELAVQCAEWAQRHRWDALLLQCPYLRNNPAQ